MSTETEIAEVKEEKVASSDNTPTENQYKIFDYFKEHTGLLVTCVSALVAIMSFILHYAVGRMNYAYLAYWDIASLYANTNNQGELYMAMFSLLYMLVLMIIHGLLSKTSDAFRYYCELLVTVKLGVRFSKKLHREYKKELGVKSDEWRCLSPKERESDRGLSIKKQLDQGYENLGAALNAWKQIKARRWRVRFKVLGQIVRVVVLSYLLGSLCLVFSNLTATIKDGFKLSWAVIITIIIDLVIYFVPAYIKAKRVSKKYKDEEVIHRMLEMADSKIPKFPIENISNWRLKSMISDRVIKSSLFLVVYATVLLLFTMSWSGTLNAEQKHRFSLCSGDSGSYAIVYISGSTVFMEEAKVQDDTIVIDTTKQRIVTKDDLSYDVKVFENVEIIRNEEEPDAEEKRELTAKGVVEAVGSFFNGIKTKIGEAMVENEGSISGTEYQPETGH